MARSENTAAADAFLDLEELGCGDLVIALMKAMRTIEGGQVIRVRAADPGAPADLPAWCNMTGHRLLAGPVGEDEDEYLIRKKKS